MTWSKTIAVHICWPKVNSWKVSGTCWFSLSVVCRFSKRIVQLTSYNCGLYYYLRLQREDETNHSQDEIQPTKIHTHIWNGRWSWWGPSCGHVILNNPLIGFLPISPGKVWVVMWTQL